MSGITLSAGVRSNLLSLQGTADLLTKTQDRLGTGLKVNGPLDNASAFFTSRALSNRASDLGALTDGMSNGLKTIDAASKGLAAITKTMDAMIGTVRQARQDASVTTEPTVSENRAFAPAAVTMEVTIAGSAAREVTFAADTTRDQALDLLNAAVTGTGVVFSAGTGSSITVTNDSPNAISFSANSVIGTEGIAAATETRTGRESLMNTFNEFRRELEQLSRDSGYNGINLLQGDTLKVVFNELTGADARSDYDVLAKNTAGTAFGAIDNASLSAANLNNDDQEIGDFGTDAGLDALLADLQGGMSTLRTISSQMGTAQTILQNRENFTKALINTLQNGADDLVLADMNEEAANSLALQTKQQLGQAALGLATRNDQAVLQLLR